MNLIKISIKLGSSLMMEEQDRERTIQSIRRYNRFYTKQIGILESSYLQSSFSLTQVRVLYELAHCDSTTPTELAKGIVLDAGYLSRILADFENGVLSTKISLRRTD